MKSGYDNETVVDKLVLRLTYYLKNKILINKHWDYVVLNFKIIGQNQRELNINYFIKGKRFELNKVEFIKFEQYDQKFFNHIIGVTGGHILVKLKINKDLSYVIENEFIK